jgi:hypothetical protein
MNLYYHTEIGEEIRSISGSLTVLEEKVLDYQGRELLCIVQVGIIDNACCGSGGCLLVEVPGYLLSREIDDRGRRISRVLPVEDDQEKAEITAALNKIYPHAQFRFA